MRENAVIIGAGQAAAQLAASLRQGAFDKPISIIGDEPYPPYQRPPLSKKFLTDRGSPESLYLRATGFWRDHGIELHSGTAAAKVDVRQRRVLLRDGRDLDYGVLVLATGTRARSLPVPGIGLANVFSLRNIEDVRRLRPALDHARRIAIIGGGYIGLEIASAMRGESREVTLVEAEARLMKRVMGEKGAAFFADVHRVRGVDIRLGVSLVAIEPAATALGVHLAPVGLLTVDLVLIATGARANDELAAAAGLACDDGVLVDERAATAAPDVYAVGDCARFPSRRYGRRIRLECVQNAIDQAKMAAAVIRGNKEPYDPVPWFWSDQYDLKLQIAGIMDGHDAAEVKGDPAAARFSVEYRRDGRLIAVDAVNDARAYMTGRRRIAEQT
ncbi:MAG TPA: FAD-dependent oxidoreductase [Xanthobacteraceae bacterium]|jgi:3-phenylpropionate/trans-cinnamate dioxygenase ferredoxin reductase subunit